MVERLFNPFTPKELMAAADDPEERAAALVRLGMATRDLYYRGAFLRIKAAMLDVTAHQSIRLASIQAAEYTNCAKFVKPLERVADEGEPDDVHVVRLHAQVLLAGWGYR
ncbi:MAG: hypothetical protein ACRDOO_02635 [Actinomadura sp.]